MCLFGDGGHLFALLSEGKPRFRQRAGGGLQQHRPHERRGAHARVAVAVCTAAVRVRVQRRRGGDYRNFNDIIRKTPARKIDKTRIKVYNGQSSA